MTTATMTDSTAPVTTPAPVEADLASIFYDETVSVVTPAPVVVPSPAPVSEPGPVVTPPAASTTATETEPTESPVGTETKAKSEEKGHVAAARRLGNEVAQLKRDLTALVEENKILKAKAEGTYEEPSAPTAEEIAARAEFRGRETASRAIAEGQYGAERVQADVYDADSPYKQLVAAQPWLHARVAKHPQPTLEALRVLEEQAFFKTYGSDVTQWVKKIEAELRPRLLDEFKRQAATPVTGGHAPTVTESRGSGGASTDKSLSDLFYGGTPVR